MKIYLDGSNVIIDTGVGIPAIIPSANTDYDVLPPVGSETILVEDTYTGANYSDLFSNIQDQAGNPIGNLDQVKAYLDGFIGSSNAAVGGATGAGVDTWYYTNTLYTGGTKLNLTHQNYSETLISDNINLLFKNNADTPHDGTKFMFAENDIIRVSVLCKIDMNINSNLVRMRLRSRDGNYTMLQTSADTNVLELGQFLEFNFPPVSINAGTAANGFDVSVFDFTSQADAFAHSFKITIEKLGTNQ